MVEHLEAIISIVIIDLVLSGDNAVVIGMAARQLSPENRRKAIVWGGVGAVGLRITFTVLAALLLSIPYLQLAGGLLLFGIAYRLLKPADHEAHINEAESLGAAIKTIILADVVMSLDNILAVGGAAEGHLLLLIFGLLFSIPILLLGSNLVARVMGQYPGILYIGVLVLVHTATSMVLEDKFVHNTVLPGFLHPATIARLDGWVIWVIALVFTVLLTGLVNLVGRLSGSSASSKPLPAAPSE